MRVDKGFCLMGINWQTNSRPVGVLVGKPEPLDREIFRRSVKKKFLRDLSDLEFASRLDFSLR